MLFNSLQFAIFLSVVFVLYWAMPHRFRWGMLLVASVWFYMSWSAKFLIFLFLIAAISFLFALWIEQAKDKVKRKTVLCMGIILCMASLVVLKYFNFASDSIAGLCSLISINFHPATLKLILPVGLSFYTFQAVAYMADVYREKIKAEHHFGYYLLFISFFPQISSGPISRAGSLLPELRKEKAFNYDQAVYGLRLILWGFFKKFVVADNLAVYVDTVYNNLPEKTGFCLVMAAVFYSVQIYCDFSGYTDIARGTAKLFNIDLIENFKSPYFSSSIKEFWARWHISLSTWFRDYVYIPLGGNRVSRARNDFNLMATFLLSGLWHGADWTFVMWGGIHGITQIIEKRFGIRSASEHRGFRYFIKVIVVFIIVTIAWILFRADSISNAGYVLANSLHGVSSLRSYISEGILGVGLTAKELLWRSALYFIPLAVFDYFSIEHDLIKEMSQLKAWQRHFIYALLIFVITFFHAYGNVSFVYFQF